MRVVEKLTKSERSLLMFLVVVFLVSTLTLLGIVNKKLFAQTPIKGGIVKEGIVGVPRFINPVLAVSDPDRDLSELVFDGLLKAESDGSYTADLAEEFIFSPDQKTVTVTLKDNLLWHDNVPLTADDVLFTIERIQDPETRSPHKASWEGVTAEKTDDRTIKFTLAAAYTPFAENLTIGIIPKHIWESVRANEMLYSTANLNAIGSGPYFINEVNQNKSGIPEYINLKSWKKHLAGEAYIPKIKISFYSNEEALVAAFKSGAITSLSGITPITAQLLESQGVKVLEAPLPRVFGVFFDQKNTSILARKEVRLALEKVINKDNLISETLLGYGTPLHGPLPPPFNEGTVSIGSASEAEAILTKVGWKKNADGLFELKTKTSTLKLSFSLSTSNSEELKQVADQLKSSWEKIGARVEVKVFDTGDLNQDVIRNRKYETLLFGEVVGRFPDPFAFWHTSQRLDPGLNIAMYSSSAVDKITTELRATSDLASRQELYSQLADGVNAETSAIFLYSPHYLYVPGEKVHNVSLSGLGGPSDRFSSVSAWYIYTEPIWEFLN